MQSPNKKTSLIEFFYIALLLTATRPPDHSLLNQRYSGYNNNHLFQFGNPNENGQLLVENNYFYDEIRSIHLSRFSYDRHFNSKSSILLQETLDVLEDINSLGRYSQIINRPSSNLIAFPVSNGFSNHSNYAVKQEDESSQQQQSPIPTTNSHSNLDNLDLDDIYYSDIWENLNDDPLIQADDDYLNGQQSLSIKTEDADNDCNNERLISLLDENGNIDNGDNEILTESSILSPISTILDNYLLNESVMLPILESPANSDVNDMFGQLELLLSNETDIYGGQEWSTTTATTPYSAATVASVTNDNVAEFPVYDAMPVSNVYDTNNGQIIPNTNSAVPQYANNNNFGSVLYSSLQTLSNGGQDHLNSDLTTANSIYNGHTASESSYLSNGSSSFNTNNHNLTTDCYYNGGSNGGYVEDINIANYTNNNTNNVNLNGGQHFDQYHPLTTSTPMHNQKFPTNSSNPEDCFDKSSDSAVSSMSSDRGQSLSDNDLIETSSESSSYHCDGNMNLDKSHAQKKYHLFGKNKIQDEKNETIENNENNVAEYYPDYYIYSNSVQCPIMETNENYNQVQNYYTTPQAIALVQHNHSYAQQPITDMIDLQQPMNSVAVTDSIPSQTEWVNSESIKIEQTSDDGTPAIQQRQQQQQQRKDRKTVKIENQEHNHNNNHHDRDYHFNRDEKRARALNIPISTHDIINLPIDEFNEKLTKYELTEIQLSLIRDIRRRGKNKVAAQNCRKRKMDQILGLQSEVDTMYSQKEQLENHYNQLLMMREMARDKYTKLYQFVVEASTSRQTFFELSSSPPDFPVKDSSTNEIMINDDSSNHRFMISTGANLTTTSSTYENGASGSTLGDLCLTNGFNDNNNNNNHQQKMNH